jgi:hypothetical protein
MIPSSLLVNTYPSGSAFVTQPLIVIEASSVPVVPVASPGVIVGGGAVSLSAWSRPPHAMVTAAHNATPNRVTDDFIL